MANLPFVFCCEGPHTTQRERDLRHGRFHEASLWILPSFCSFASQFFIPLFRSLQPRRLGPSALRAIRASTPVWISFLGKSVCLDGEFLSRNNTRRGYNRFLHPESWEHARRKAWALWAWWKPTWGSVTALGPRSWLGRGLRTFL